jgi:hypothetical protein
MGWPLSRLLYQNLATGETHEIPWTTRGRHVLLDYTAEGRLLLGRYDGRGTNPHTHMFVGSVEEGTLRELTQIEGFVQAARLDEGRNAIVYTAALVDSRSGQAQHMVGDLSLSASRVARSEPGFSPFLSPQDVGSSFAGWLAFDPTVRWWYPLPAEGVDGTARALPINWAGVQQAGGSGDLAPLYDYGDADTAWGRAPLVLENSLVAYVTAGEQLRLRTPDGAADFVALEGVDAIWPLPGE